MSKALWTQAFPEQVRKVVNKRACYPKAKKAYLETHLKCEICSRPATDLHHRKGRGKYLCDPVFFMALCRRCHNLVHREVAWAYSEGHLIMRG